MGDISVFRTELSYKFSVSRNSDTRGCTAVPNYAISRRERPLVRIITKTWVIQYSPLTTFSLALSTRRPCNLKPELLKDRLVNFLRCKYVQDTDSRLASLFKVAYGTHFTGCRPTNIESVEAFDKDVQLIEQHFMSNVNDQSMDGFTQHFPFISLRWYRLSYVCAFLDVAEPSQRRGKALTWAVDWASQILIYLSQAPSYERLNNIGSDIPSQLEPNPSVVEIMSFAIDHYFVVITYAAFFLVNSWLNNLVDSKSRSL